MNVKIKSDGKWVDADDFSGVGGNVEIIFETISGWWWVEGEWGVRDDRRDEFEMTVG